MKETPVVTAFLRNRGEVLLLRRSDAVGSYAGRWGAVAGHVEGEPTDTAYREIREETGLGSDAVSLVRRGEPFTVEDRELGTAWVVHPFLFEAATRDIEPNWETTANEWVAPTELRRRETVPRLWESYDRVRPRVATIETDSDHGSATLSYRALGVLRDEAGLAATGGGTDEGLHEIVQALRTARPSMAVIRNRVDRAVAAALASPTTARSDALEPDALESETLESSALEAEPLEESAHEGIGAAIDADRGAAETAAELVDGKRVGTLSRSGTVLRALTAGDPEAVLVATSHPGGEGVGVAEEVATETDVTLTTDAAFPHELLAWEADLLLVGADSILPDGRVVNKVGTRGAAAVARDETVGCYVAAATDKVRIDGAVDREYRDGSEVYDGDLPIGTANPTFDVTPGEYLDGFATERGVLSVEDIDSVARELRADERLVDRLLGG